MWLYTNTSTKYWQYRLNWMRSLKVGDIIVYCSRKVRIVKIIEDKEVTQSKWFKAFVSSNLMPTAVAERLQKLHNLVHRRLGTLTVIDKTLMLEDGSVCSAMIHCDAHHDYAL